MSIFRIVGNEFWFARRRGGAEVLALNDLIVKLRFRITSKIEAGFVTSAPLRLRANEILFSGQAT